LIDSLSAAACTEVVLAKLADSGGRKPDRSPDPLGFEEPIDPRLGEGRVGAEVETRDYVAIAGHNWPKHALSPVGAVYIAGAQRAEFQIAELVDDEKWVIAGKTKVAVPYTYLLFAMSRADAGLHVEPMAFGGRLP
jgi:hypothetical protein